MGRIIDSHDAVFRFNAFSSLGDWVNFTGSKSTYRIFNKKRAETMSSSGNQFRKAGNASILVHRSIHRSTHLVH